MKYNLKTVMPSLLLGGAMALAVPFPAMAVHDTGTFELDRNAIDGGAAGVLPDDWNTLYGGGGHAFAFTGVIADPTPENSIFTSGGSKDDNDISQWKWKNASNILDKDNITNAYAAAYAVAFPADLVNPVHLVIYYGLDRFSNDGSAQVGFWFFKNAISLNGDGNSGGGDTFSGVHADGDVLVQSNFSNGGTVSTVTVYEWLNGNLVQIGSGGDCIPGSAGDPVCATVNQDVDPSANTSPWPYTPKANNGSPGFFPHGTFFEGGIDLTALGLTDACFSTFMAETRSSNPFNSVLKDFVGPRDFDTCNIEVTKNCTNPRFNDAETGIIYDITGKVTASGFGSSLFDVTLEDSPVADGPFDWVDCADPSNVLGTFPLDTLNGEACYKNTMTVPLNQNGQDDTVTATAHTGDNGTGTLLEDQVTADCPLLQISPALSVTKNCSSSVEVSGGKVVAKVAVSGQVCNIGDGTLHNVTVSDFSTPGITTTPAPLIDNIDLVEGACEPYAGSYYPSVANDVTDNPTTDAHSVVFKDTVRATATDVFGAGVTPQTAPAQCPLCIEPE